MWKNIVQPDRPQVTLWRMRIACWIPKATDTDSEYVILIDLPRQHERASILRHTYIACLVANFSIHVQINFEENFYLQISKASHWMARFQGKWHKTL